MSKYWIKCLCCISILTLTNAVYAETDAGKDTSKNDIKKLVKSKPFQQAIKKATQQELAETAKLAKADADKKEKEKKKIEAKQKADKQAEIEESKKTKDSVTDFGLAPAILFLFYSDENIKDAVVKNNKSVVTESTRGEIRIGVEGHMTFGSNWFYKKSDRKSMRLSTGPFVCFIFNGDSIPIGGGGVLFSMQRWSDSQKPVSAALNIGAGAFLDNSFRSLPDGYTDNEDLPEGVSIPNGEKVELRKKTGWGGLVMISFNVDVY